MRAEKKAISAEYAARLNSSPFFIVTDYTGLKVAVFTELRKRLRAAGAEVHVVKNSIFRVAAKDVGVADLTGSLTGQVAVVTGQKDVSAAAKVLKNFVAEFDKPKIKFGFLNSQRLDEAALKALADLPSLEVLRGRLLGAFKAPAQRIAALINTPAAQLVRVLQAKAEKAA
jgi:large subunit ribosomal protein L10